MQENWDYSKHPTGKNPILTNYIQHIFCKIQAEEKIEYEDDFCCFNTGLTTENQEEIFGYLQKNKKPGTTIPYFLLVGENQATEIYLNSGNWQKQLLLLMIHLI